MSVQFGYLLDTGCSQSRERKTCTGKVFSYLLTFPILCILMWHSTLYFIKSLYQKAINITAMWLLDKFYLSVGSCSCKNTQKFCCLTNNWWWHFKGCPFWSSSNCPHSLAMSVWQSDKAFSAHKTHTSTKPKIPLSGPSSCWVHSSELVLLMIVKQFVVPGKQHWSSVSLDRAHQMCNLPPPLPLSLL